MGGNSLLHGAAANVLRDACCGMRVAVHASRPTFSACGHPPPSSFTTLAAPYRQPRRSHARAGGSSRRLTDCGACASHATRVQRVQSIANVAKIALARAGFVRGTENEKRPLAAAVLVEVGGGGENRTRVRKPSAVGTTCLVSSFGSRSPDAGGQAAGEPVTLL